MAEIKNNTQNAKIASIIEKSLVVGIDIGSERHFARACDWGNFEYIRNPFQFSDNGSGFQMFKAWIEDFLEKNGKAVVISGMESIGRSRVCQTCGFRHRKS